MQKTLSTTTLPTLSDLLPSWELRLTAQRKSPRTIQSYVESARQFIAFLEAKGMPTVAPDITGEHLDAFIVDQLERNKPATAAVRYRSLQQLWKWMEAEGEVADTPFRKMKPPKIDEVPVPIFTDEETRALLAACAGAGFEERRDTAIMRMFDGTGVRLAELANLSLTDVDLQARTATVYGWGGKVRTVRLTPKVAEAVDRYFRIRRRHPNADEPWLWLGAKGRLTVSGVNQMLKRRGRQAGVADVHAHRFRHSFSHNWRAAEGSEDGLMQANGWTSRTMLGRYAKSTAAARAPAEADRLGVGDRL